MCYNSINERERKGEKIMKNIQNIINTIEASKSLSYDIMNSTNTVIIVIEDFQGFDEDWNEIIVRVDVGEVAWAESIDGETVDGWEIVVKWASEDI